MIFRHLVTHLLVLGFAALVQGGETIEYNRDIRPILAENCFACHGADSAARKADLRLDQREAAIDFGAIAPGLPDESELMARALATDPDLVMPPPEIKKQLTQQQKDLLKEWIASGAEYQPHWSFIRPQSPELPTVGNEAWVRNAIDRFVAARLETNGLAPAPEAAPHTIFRRLHLDITGLPPSAEDVAAFVADYQARKDLALSEWIDRLMDSTAWGEHRARYWLDAARYADTHGMHFDNYREMWPYRDWVIRAFNANQPFDQFTVEQLAGDMLDQPTDDQLIATGFQRCNVTTNEGGTIDEENLMLYAADRVQTFGWVFLGLTTNCSQCHDHKFDPLTMRDYYSLAAFFRNTEAPPKDGNSKDGNGPVLLVPSESDKDRWIALPQEIENTKSRREQRRQLTDNAFQTWLKNATPEAMVGSTSEGLVLHVPLDEGQGSEVRNLVGSLGIVSATDTVDWQSEGKIGPAPVIRPGNTFTVGDVGDFEIDQAFSYGAWVQTTEKAAQRGVSAAILARMDEGNSHRGWDLWQSGTSLAVHIIDAWDSNAMKVTTEQGVVKPGTWQHVFATYDGSGKVAGIKIYVDGQSMPLNVEKNTLKEGASIRTSTPLRIGQRSSSAVFDGGLVQDVRIYNRQLPGNEVLALAKHQDISTVLAIADDKRTKEQRELLLDFYLTSIDSGYQQLNEQVTALEGELNDIRARSPVTHIQREKKDSTAKAHILMRGAYDQPGEEVTANTPAALHPMPDGAPRNRLSLAQWVVDPANPLTARVTVNRFWQQVFGQGLVSTTEDFGVTGTLPSHPQLLDWLACNFVDNGWDVKQFFKQIFMSATYRQAALVSPAKLEADPNNVLLSRGPRFRMDAEMVRDFALAVSGLLSPKMYGPGVKPYQPGDIWNIVGLPSGNTRDYRQDQGEDLYRRTIYNFWKRMAPPPSMEAFNAPSREVCTVHRERTNTPLQALVTLNDPQFVEAARRLAENAIKTGGSDEMAIIEYFAHRVLARSFSVQERTLVLEMQHEYLAHYRAEQEAAQSLISVGESRVDETIDVPTLAAWTMVCNQIINLDEALNK